jgi:hypothetical protein
MAKLVTKISDTIKTHLHPGEELRSVGQLASGLPEGFYMRAPDILAPLFAKSRKFWWAGVTGDRLILIQLDLLSRPRADSVLSIPLDHIEVKNKSLFIDHLMTSNSGLLSFYPDFNALDTMRFLCHFGHKLFNSLTGLNVEEFLAALSTPGR